jgi:predicted MPP superfamily phosphohydrolase
LIRNPYLWGGYIEIILLSYLAAISLIAIVLTLYDKNAARKNAWRIRERTLLTIAALGGSAAMLLIMLLIRHKTRHVKFMLGIPLILLMQAAITVAALDTSLSVSYHSVATDKIGGQVKFALIADYHSCDYGDGQSELIRAIDKEKPQALLLAGDIFDDILPPDNIIEFLSGVADRYPCYYVSGNHEFWSRQADDFKAILESYGVKVLEGSSEILSIGDDKIRISGLDDPDTDQFANRSAPYAEQLARLSASAEPEVFTILLSHRPERIDELLPLSPDLVLSGHAHGGQWRVPFILENGLLAPNQGWLPKYANGAFSLVDTKLIVSRGLARESTAVPRVFNRPEVVLITVEGIG